MRKEARDVAQWRVLAWHVPGPGVHPQHLQKKKETTGPVGWLQTETCYYTLQSNVDPQNPCGRRRELFLQVVLLAPSGTGTMACTATHTHVKTNKHVKIVKAIKPLYGRARPTLMPTASHSFGNPLTQLIRAHSQHSLCAPPTWASVLTHTLYTSSRLHTRTHTCARPNNHTGFLLSN